jgi:hypothetical protein
MDLSKAYHQNQAPELTEYTRAVDDVNHSPETWERRTSKTLTCTLSHYHDQEWATAQLLALCAGLRLTWLFLPVKLPTSVARLLTPALAPARLCICLCSPYGLFKSCGWSRVPVAHACNPGYSGGRG